MNRNLYAELQVTIRDRGVPAALRQYARYLNHRNASYFHLEGNGISAFAGEAPDWDPFGAVTGYHRIAVDTIQALCNEAPSEIVLNVANEGALESLLPTDVVEIKCMVSQDRIRRPAPATVPRQVSHLIEGMKTFDRTLLRALRERDQRILQFALTGHPLIGDWDRAGRLIKALSLSN